MIMILIRIALVTAVLCAAGPAVADDATPDTAGGRYVFAKQADGFVRLDTQTGEVSLCGQKSVGWACEAAPEDRAVLESEIARLRTENATLKKDLPTSTAWSRSWITSGIGSSMRSSGRRSRS
jgi:hypothetical protein